MITLTGHRLRASQAAGRRMHPNSGLTARIRALLEKCPGLTSQQIARRLHRDLKAVRGMLQQMCMTTGGVVSDGPRRERTYRLFKVAPQLPQRARSGRIAGPITIPCYRWGSSRLTW